MLDGESLILVADEVSARQNSDAIVLNVLENDIFPDDYEGNREISSFSYGSQGGSISIGDDSRSIVYRPPADFHGLEKFSYFVDNEAFADVFVEIESPMRDDKFTLPPDGVTRTLDVLSNDPFWFDYDGPRQISLVSTSRKRE